jgi:Arm DNA-binding domain
MGLGGCADFTLEEARERARLARQLLKDGHDPLDKAHEAVPRSPVRLLRPSPSSKRQTLILNSTPPSGRTIATNN